MPKDTNQIETTKIEPNISAIFCYLLPIFGGIVFYIKEKDNNFVKFHAVQSILFGLLIWGSTLLMQYLQFGFVINIIVPVFSFIAFVIWASLMWHAYNYHEFELPYLGKLSRTIMNQKTK